MQLISPTKLQKKKLKEIIQKLFPKYQYVQYGPSGLIFLSKSFWHFLFNRETIHISEMCTVYIPERLEELESRTITETDGHPPYRRVYNKYSHIVLDLLHHRANGVIDYLYDEYISVKYGIQKTYYTRNNLLPQKAYSLSQILFGKKDSVVLSSFSTAHIKEALKQWKDSVFVLNHPILRSKTLDLWFNQELKKELSYIYNIRIAYA